MADRVCPNCKRMMPESEMVKLRRGKGRGVVIWKCRRCLEACKASQEERDRFGQELAELNRAKSYRTRLAKAAAEKKLQQLTSK